MPQHEDATTGLRFRWGDATEGEPAPVWDVVNSKTGVTMGKSNLQPTYCDLLFLVSDAKHATRLLQVLQTAMR